MATKKTATPKAKASAASQGVALHPNIPLFPGNVGTFTARQGEGLVEAEVVTNRDSWRGQVSNTEEGASVSKLIETGHTEVTVTFYENGKGYASGTFTVD